MPDLELRFGLDALDTLRATAPTFDALVDRTPGIDRFCSSTDWIVPAEHVFGGDDPVLVAGFGSLETGGTPRRPPATAGLALASSRTTSGRVLRGLDPLWGYATPVVAPDPSVAAELFDATLRADPCRWDLCLLSGLPPGGMAFSALVGRLRDRYRLGLGQQVGRRVAHLDGGLEGFLARRSSTFRRNARRAQRAADGAGIEFDFVRGGGRELVERAIAAEARSWKGQQGSGLTERSFATFYLQIADRLASTGRLRAGFARRDGVDVGFILGAVRGDTYRGFQLAYDDRLAELSIGNLLQLGQIADLQTEPAITTYDLGQDMPYKTSWSDELFVTDTLVVLRR